MRYYFSIFDIYPYVLLFFILYLIINSKTLKDRLAKMAIVVVVFLGIRYGVGYDYFEYREWIISPDLKTQEPLIQLLAEFCSKIHYQLFFAITSILSIFSVYKVSKKYSIDPIMSFMVYMLVPMLFLDGMSTVRNAIAYPMVLWSFMILLKEKRKYLAVIPFLIAINIHGSAIVALLFLPFAFLRIKRGHALIAWIVSFAFSQTQITGVLLDYMNVPYLSKAMWYLNHSRENTSGGTLWLAVNAINLINFVYWNKLKNIDECSVFYLMAYCLGCILYNIAIKVDPTIALRLSNYGSIFLMLIAPYYAYVLPYRQHRNQRLIYLFFIFYFSSLLFIVILKTPPGDKMSFFPYQTIFNHVDYSNLQ